MAAVDESLAVEEGFVLDEGLAADGFVMAEGLAVDGFTVNEGLVVDGFVVDEGVAVDGLEVEESFVVVVGFGVEGVLVVEKTRLASFESFKFLARERFEVDADFAANEVLEFLVRF